MFCRVIPRFVNVPKCNSIISILSVRSISRCVESLVVALLVSLCPRKEVSQNIYLSNSLRESETSTDNDMSATQFCSLSNLLHLSCCIQRPLGLIIDKKRPGSHSVHSMSCPAIQYVISESILCTLCVLLAR